MAQGSNCHHTTSSYIKLWPIKYDFFFFELSLNGQISHKHEKNDYLENANLKVSK